MSDRNRVLITGIGVVSPFGNREEFWQRLLAGERATRRLEVPSEDASLWIPNAAGAPAVSSKTLEPALQSRSRDDLMAVSEEPVTAHALAASLEAVEDSGLADGALSENPRAGCIIGSSKGGVLSQQRACAGQRRIADLTVNETDGNPISWSMLAPHGASQAVASLFGIQGPMLTPVAACATGLASLVRAAMLIQSGECDFVLAGSSDASLTPAIVATFRRLGVLSKQTDGPQAAVRPFDRSRDGFLIGEGAGVLVLESEKHATRRAARPYAEWLSGGSVADTFAMTKLADDSEALCWLIDDVLCRAGLGSSDLDYLSLHGTATRMNDACEMRALKRSLGPAAGAVSASSIKGAIGHLLGAAGSVEFASMLLAMRDGQLPPTANLHSPDDGFDLDLVPRVSRRRDVQHAMKLSLGFGGHLFAAAVRRVEGRSRD